MTHLLDANVLIGLLVTEHVHHKAASAWLAEHDRPFATCPITQGALVRIVVRSGGFADEARALLDGLEKDERHELWPDDLPYTAVRLSGVIGHRQVTDAYLTQLARAHGGRLATFDEGLAALHVDVAELIATG